MTATSLSSGEQAQPAAKRAPGNKGKRLPSESYSMAEIEQFLAAFPASKTGVRNRALFALMCFSGLRIQEALDLALDDVHLDGDVPGVRVRCRDGRERMRLLHPKALPFITAWLAVRPEGAVLFCTHPGRAIDASYVRRALGRLKEHVGFTRRLHPQGCRKTWCQWSQ